MIVIKIVIQEDKEQNFLETMGELIEATRKESGCIRYDLV